MQNKYKNFGAGFTKKKRNIFSNVANKYIGCKTMEMFPYFSCIMNKKNP